MYSVSPEVHAAVKMPCLFKPLHRTARQTLMGSRLSSVDVSETPPLFDFHMEVLKGDLEWVIPLWKASIWEIGIS